jgi:hypothetical protein
MMIGACTKTLKELGVPPSQIAHDEFQLARGTGLATSVDRIK